MDSRLQLEPRIKRALSWRNLSQLPALQDFSEKFLLGLGIAIAYFLGSQLGFGFTVDARPISALWPPNAILMAILLSLRASLWPYALFCVLPAHIAVQLLNHISLPTILSRYVSNVGEALIGAMLIRYTVGSRLSFGRARDTGLFLVCGVIGTPLLGSALDIFLLRIVAGGQEPFSVLWSHRVLSNAVSILILVPVIVTIVQRKKLRPVLRTTKRRVEAAGLFIFLYGICALGFIAGGTVNIFHGSILFALFPIMIWSAMRFSSDVVALVLLVVSLFGVWGAQHWEGPFIRANAMENVFGLHFFVIFAGAPLLLLSAAVSEWRTADAFARRRKKQLDLALAAGKLNLWKWEIDGVTSNRNIKINADKYGADTTIEMPQFFRHVHPDDRKKLEESLTDAFIENKPFELELRVTESDKDTYRWFSSRGIWQLRSDGKPFQLLGVNADITQHKNEYAQIQRQRDELAHLSRVGMLGEMSGAIAHELKQPLTAILCNAQAAVRMLRKSPPDMAEISEILTDIVSEDKRAGEIIQRMRELIKKGPIKLEAVDINDVVGRAIALERSDLISRNIIVKTDLEKKLPLVLADSVQVIQVLLNLIINACDAMHGLPINERLLHVATTRVNAASVSISIADRGKGIAAEEMESIFDPFFTSKSEGLGLGLTICRSVIEAHDGQLMVENNCNGGATFSFTLPVFVEAEVAVH